MPESKILVPPTPARSRNMSAIRGKGNKSTEMRMASLLRCERLNGWRRHQPLPGRPDFAWRVQRTALFVDGCYWHGCPRCYKSPSKNVEFWRNKLLTNRRRDRRVSAQLRKLGWRVIRVWECRVGSPATLTRIRHALQSARSHVP
ncbi:MAG: very short patch repair endonuclease [Gemmatimonadota bacterium]